LAEKRGMGHLKNDTFKALSFPKYDFASIIIAYDEITRPRIGTPLPLTGQDSSPQSGYNIGAD